MKPELQSFLKACQTKDTGAATRVLERAVEDETWSETDLANLSSAAFNARRAIEPSGVLQAFHRRFPSSLHPVQAKLATLYAEAGEADAATHHARHFLSRLKQAGVFEDSRRAPEGSQYIAEAFLAATAAYTKLGWLSYSLRILAFAKNLPGVARPFLDEESAKLEEKLKATQATALDIGWEAAYQSGTNHLDMRERAVLEELPEMVKRIEQVQTALRFEGAPKWEKEFFRTAF